MLSRAEGDPCPFLPGTFRPDGLGATAESRFTHRLLIAVADGVAVLQVR